jgi:F-type H+-transporting ATPase subunit delta
MAELTTIARPYAEAAFRIAREENALPAWSEMLRFMSAVIEDPKVAAALDNPKLQAPQKESLLLTVGGERLSPSGRNFVRVLVDGDRVSLLPQITELFDALKAGAEGVARATIETAFPLDDSQVATLTQALERRFGRKIEATVTVDPSLLGGARVSVGDTVIDGSVRARLEAMAVQLRA